MLWSLNDAGTRPFLVEASPGQPYIPPGSLPSSSVLISKNGAGWTTPQFGGATPTDIGNGCWTWPVGVNDTDTLGALSWCFIFNDGSGQQALFQDQVLASVPGGPGTLTNGERDAIAAVVLGLSNGVDTGVSLAHASMAMAAVLAGKTTVAGDTISFRNWQDTKNRVVIKSNVSGRYQVTFDFS